jgi:transposase-like protein
MPERGFDFGAPQRSRQRCGRSSTPAIESLNHLLRKIITNRGHFPNDSAVISSWPAGRYAH